MAKRPAGPNPRFGATAAVEPETEWVRVHADREFDIAFSEGRSGSGRATWGQHAIWDVVRTLGTDAARYNVTCRTHLNPPMTVDALTTLVRELILLHDSLRTRLSVGVDGKLRQEVHSRGGIPVVIWQSAPDELTRSANALQQELTASPFDCERQWPVRVGIIEIDGLAHHVVFCLSHTASDGWGVRNLLADLFALRAGQSADSIRARQVRLQPLEEARFQASGRGQRRDAAARKSWHDTLRSGPPSLFPKHAGQPPARRFPNAVLRSPALAMAVAHVTTRLAVSPASVLLAAAAASVSRLSGVTEAVFQVVANNRFLPGMAGAVNTVAQEGLFHLTGTGDDFAQLIHRAFSATISTQRRAYYDKLALDRDIATIRERGEAIGDYSCVVNDFRGLWPAKLCPRPTPEPLAQALTRTELTWPVEFEPRRNLTFALDANDIPGATKLAMTADSALLPQPDMERFLLGIEDLVVGQALALGAD